MPDHSGLWTALCCMTLFGMLVLIPNAAFSQPVRTAWTTSRISGSPDPAPPLQTVPKFSALKFDRPLLIRTDSAEQRLWVVEQGGTISSFPDDPNVTEASLFVDFQKSFDQLKPHPDASGFGFAYGLAFHPQYPKVPVCWITYTLNSAKENHHLEDGTRLSRFDITFDDSGVPHCDVASEEVLLTWLEGGHNGACLEFGPDGYLYVSAGDGEVPNPPDPRDAGQDVSNLLSTVLRIDVMPQGNDPLYKVPADNPFVELKNARPEIWAYGFRNPWKMTFAPNGELWLGDVGWELYEMVYRIRKGGNYGWSIMEGPQPVRPNARRGPTEILSAAIALPHTDAASVTGGYVYRGQRFPELAGTYIFGDFETRRIWSARFDGEKLTSLTDLVRPSLRLVAFGEDTSKELLMLSYEDGTIHELQRGMPSESVHPFPDRLSHTGLFDDLKSLRPAAGVIRFEINAPMWNDGAKAERLLAVPGEGKIEVLKEGTRRANWMWRETMLFPKDSVLARTVSLADDAARDVRLETQLLHFDGIDWKGYSYAWSPDQRDAELVPSAGRELELKDYGNFRTAATSTWRIQSRTECQRCHNHWVGGPLGFLPPQLNRVIATSSGSMINQLHALRDGGWLTGEVPNDPQLADAHAAALTDPGDDAADNALRARSWLAANCSYCHQQHAGGTATIDLRHAIESSEMRLIGISPVQGTFDLNAAMLVSPGNPTESVLLYRISTAGRGHMPHIGSATPDPRGISVVRNWIQSLEPGAAHPATAKKDSVPMELTSTTQALEWMLALHDNSIEADDRQRLLEAARRAPPGISNLFERFQPVELRRRIRTTIDPAGLLAVAGDANAGRERFFDKRMQCAVCHRIGTQGGAVGPALDDVGKRQTRAEILASLLEPSKKIDPKFATWVVQTRDGKVHSGLLISRDEQKIVIRNAKAEDTILNANDVEELQPQAISLMPEKQLNDLSDADIAGLLEFLSQQKSLSAQ
ncbi:MAG: PQQ-dependent sugar dehydrogenase [Planctomycetaceae bacterium]